MLVLVGKTTEWHPVMMALLRLGAVSVPCSEMLRHKDLAFRVDHSGSRVVVADPAAEAEVAGLDADVIYTDTPGLDAQPQRAPCADTAASDPAFILYTSGTTKDPKGVVHSHAYCFAKRMQAERWLGGASRRPGLVHRRDGLGEVDLERAAGPVECGRRDRAARGRVRSGGALPAALSARRDGAVPGAHGVPADGEAGRDRSLRPHARPAHGLGRRAAQPRGDQSVPGRVRADDPRRIRPDREHAARRQHAGRRDPAGVDGASVAGPRDRRDRRGRERRPGRRGGRHRTRRPAAEPLPRVLPRAGRDGGRVSRRLVRDR